MTSREAATSGLVSTALFAIGSALVTAYLRRKHLADLYEGASAVVVAAIHGRGVVPERTPDSSG